LKDKDKQLAVSFTGSMLAAVAIYLIFSRWVAVIVLIGMATWATLLFCYPLLKEEKQSSFIRYAIWRTFYVGLMVLGVYLFQKLRT